MDNQIKTKEKEVPDFLDLKNGYTNSVLLTENVVLKKYLQNLTELELVPLKDEFDKIGDVRIFKITEMVYQKEEFSIYKFASVFNSVQSLDCTVFIIADSDGEKTDFYMGVRSLNNRRSPSSLKDTLESSLRGQFPGVKTKNLFEADVAKLFADIQCGNIASVSCVAGNKDKDFKENEIFVQGLEKFADAMQGQKYTAVVMSRSVSQAELDLIRREYESVYTGLSLFSTMQVSYGRNEALSISEAISDGKTVGTSYTKTTGQARSTTTSEAKTDTFSVSTPNLVGIVGKGLLKAARMTIGAGAASAVVAGAAATAGFGMDMAARKRENKKNSPFSVVSEGESETRTYTSGETTSESEAFGKSESRTETETHTEGTTSGRNENLQLTMQNKSIQTMLDRLDIQLKRLDECENVGMWECAAYFLSDSQETAEMAAGTYKAIMKGSESGVETSAINLWNRHRDGEKLFMLKKYITNFIHPEFSYYSEHKNSPTVTAASLISGNELAIHMGLPRKSVCGFPVIEHADFGKEVVSYEGHKEGAKIRLGKVFNMGTETKTDVGLDVDSLTMHTFITGSTGSGKSNTVYHILNQLYTLYRIPFLVVEPAKGEYKNVFGHEPGVSVYGTNPKKTAMLKINPFSFPDDVHVLEHIDRLVEIFNVCWPMYAAMPAILKDATERAYVAAGWDLALSENRNERKFPNFADLLEQIEVVINESKYSSDTKGDYSGALLTRVRSLTTGLNRLIFCNDEISEEDLFDRRVIVDLSRVGSTETKSLIMGLLVMKLNEYRMSSGRMNSSLSHVTVLEEAHNLLKRTSTEQSSEGANLLGKSVELLANSIAEMRTYGEGFIIADQSPGLLDMSVIRNTNTKIILRLPEQSDRELAGYAAGMNDEQIQEIARLKRGVAAVYQNDWIEPVLVQVRKCNLQEAPYALPEAYELMEAKNIRDQIINFLIQGRVSEKLEFSISDIEKGLDYLGWTTEDVDYMEELLEEYKENSAIELWNDNNFGRLAKKVSKISGVRETVDKSVLTASDEAELTDMLNDIVLQLYPDASYQKAIVISQCFMKDMSMQPKENKTRRKIYTGWFRYIYERGVR